MELFDVLEESGRPTGRSKPRQEVHRDGDWHRSVHVWILNSQNGLLLQRRSLNKDTNPGLWDVSAAGHLSAGETSLETAVKEVGEELGLAISPDDLEFLFTISTPCPYPELKVIDNEIQDVYLLRRDVPLSQLVPQQEEVAELKYVPVTNLRDLLSLEPSVFVSHPEEYRCLFELLLKP